SSGFVAVFPGPKPIWAQSQPASATHAATTSPTVKRRRMRSGLRVCQPAVQVVVVRAQIEEAVTGVVEEDHALLARLLRRERLVDRGAHGVARLRGGQLALRVGELDRGLERLALRVRD